MKLANDTVTVFTQAVDPATKAPVYAPTVIAGVSWYATAADTVDPKGGLVAARKVIVRIPAEALPGGLEIKAGDIIVKGEAEGNMSPAQLRADYPDFMTVLAVTDNRRAPNAPHLRIEGK